MRNTKENPCDSFALAMGVTPSQYGPGIHKTYDAGFQFNHNAIPQDLKDHDQWVCWSSVYTIDKDSGVINDKPSKRPVYAIDGKIHLAKWNAMSFDDAMKLMGTSQDIHGLGFIFTADDPFIVIDFDNLVDRNDDRFGFINNADTYVEKSVSGKGYHMIVKGKLNKQYVTQGVEIYGAGTHRLIAMTGDLAFKKCEDIKEDQGVVDALVQAYFNGESGSGRYKLPSMVVEGERNNNMMSYVGSLFSKGLSLDEVESKVHKANAERFKPPLDEDVVEGMCKRILSAREKDIDMADARNQDVVDRYIFVTTSNKYYDTITRTELTDKAMNVKYGHREFGGRGNPRPVTWLVRQNNLRKVERVGWMPSPYGKERENQIIIDGPRSMVNSWEGFAITPAEGDVQPWLDHVAHLMGDVEYQKNFIDRLAFDVQHPDKKCNWTPALFGTYGAGKDAVFDPIMTIFGSASKLIGSNSVKSSFDDGFIGAKIVVISEIKGLGGDALEELKRSTASGASKWIELDPKGRSPVRQVNVVSVYIITNHPDALKLDKNERRFYVNHCKVAMNEDQKKAYFTHWLERDNGAARLMHFLLNRDLSGFNPNKLPRHTSGFLTMVDSTQRDYEALLNDWLDLEKFEFAYQVVHPRHIQMRLSEQAGGVKADTSQIKTWLINNGFNQCEKRIRQRGGERNFKSRGYFVSGDFADLDPGEMYDEISRIEEVLPRKTE